ncbi:MAG: hypothetical protein EA381_01750 [Planctomycetaceae bacterium]|nr:MAG: hypothetical protein EA381_01750 [Planctomycetaceae bacterium]
MRIFEAMSQLHKRLVERLTSESKGEVSSEIKANTLVLVISGVVSESQQPTEYCIRWMCIRWMIGICFRTLKSSSRIERRRFETIERFGRCLTLSISASAAGVLAQNPVQASVDLCMTTRAYATGKYVTPSGLRKQAVMLDSGCTQLVGVRLHRIILGNSERTVSEGVD